MIFISDFASFLLRLGQFARGSELSVSDPPSLPRTIHQYARSSLPPSQDCGETYFEASTIWSCVFLWFFSFHQGICDLHRMYPLLCARSFSSVCPRSDAPLTLVLAMQGQTIFSSVLN